LSISAEEIVKEALGGYEWETFGSDAEILVEGDEQAMADLEYIRGAIRNCM
jgi:hypothetical protein